jgi:hypothetical protein
MQLLETLHKTTVSVSRFLVHNLFLKSNNAINVLTVVLCVVLYVLNLVFGSEKQANIDGIWKRNNYFLFVVVDPFLIVSMFCVWFEVTIAVAMKSKIFWSVILCSSEEVPSFEALFSTEIFGLSEIHRVTTQKTILFNIYSEILFCFLIFRKMP